MMYDAWFQQPEESNAVLRAIETFTEGRTEAPLRFMEICGTHTMAIARTGLKALLPPSIRLISGPGCPVCVTPAGMIDAALKLSELPHVTIATYGDLLRVPGTARGDCLLRRKALGASVEMVYSPMDALALAGAQPRRQVVFLGVGFETTAPGTAVCLLEAAKNRISNFSVFCLLKRTEPALRALLAQPDFLADGLLCPGHVAAVIGSSAFSFLADEYGLPAVVSGFEAADLLYSILELTRMAVAGTNSSDGGRTPGYRPQGGQKIPGKRLFKNEYTRAVKPQGNPTACQIMEQVFTPCGCEWRGLGYVPDGGFCIRTEYESWDAAKRFSLTASGRSDPPGCQCADVICGRLEPDGCPLFGRLCTPADPVGPCMVSSEGACAAAFLYVSRT